jgi:CTP-dependent riboflavin kinase
MTRIFIGTVVGGYGLATPNLDPVMQLIEARTGLTNLVSGTLNVTIPDEYIVPADAVLTPDEYPYNKASNLHETIKFRRCLVAGYKALIMRPDSHEIGAGQFHGKNYLELMGQRNFRETLRLQDGSTVEVQVEGDGDWWTSGK